MAIYNASQETEDINLLRSMRFKVENPNSKKHIERVKKIRYSSMSLDPGAEIMEYFTKLVKKSDALAFRALPDGSITAGVHKEIVTAQKNNIPVLELPYCDKRKILSVEETRSYLRGKR